MTQARAGFCLLLASLAGSVGISHADEETRVSATLGFSGWGSDAGATIRGAIGFEGWGAETAARQAALAFTGFGGPDPAIDGGLAFAGWALTKVGPKADLTFSGWGTTQEAPKAKLAFSGWAKDGPTIETSLAFAGWGADTARVQGPLSFSGFGDPSDAQAMALAFAGWAMDQPELSGAVSFAGCIRDETIAPHPPLPPEVVRAHFASTDTGPNLDLEGNWRITWDDAPISSAFATLTKGGSWSCMPGGDGCWYAFSRDPSAPWLIDMYIPELTLFESEATIGPGRQFSAQYYYQVLGHWGGTSRGVATENTIVGQWSYGEEGGREVWTRVPGTITAAAGSDGRVAPLGQAVSVVTEYVDATYTMRGNRPEASLRVLGDQLWGVQRYWIPADSDIEIGRVWYMCADWAETGEVYDGHEGCFSSGGAVGLRFDLNIWPDAKPGWHYLYLNDVAIPFELEIQGYPECGT